jgi:hypothetical protein
MNENIANQLPSAALNEDLREKFIQLKDGVLTILQKCSQDRNTESWKLGTLQRTRVVKQE